jgi:hypothetical protein
MATPTIARPIGTFTIDGTVFDLSVPWVDTVGVTWRFTGEWTLAGEPLMVAEADGEHREGPVSLPDVYHDHGPLIPVHPLRINRMAWLRAVTS